ncbi:hypothetical protein L7F57_002758 [Escherichia coli]|nr:hypothetical protein [Escherichia coli]
MESNIKGLVTAGHEMASELKAECGAVDIRVYITWESLINLAWSAIRG